jgi:uncharacterized protein with von Willebrand factor type A (vWA) domain
MDIADPTEDTIPSPDSITFLALPVPQPITDGSASLAHDGYDVQTWHSSLHDFTRLAQSVHAQSQTLITAPALLRDLFWSFLKRVPTVLPPVPLTPSYHLNARIVEQVMATIEWKHTRTAGTVDDPLSAAMATIGVAEQVLSTLDDATRAQVLALHEAESGMNALFDQAQTLEDLASQAQGDRAQTLFRQATDARTQVSELQTQAHQLETELLPVLDAQEDTLRRAARHALTQVEGEVETFRTTNAAFGTLTPQDKIALAGTMGQSRRLQEIAALCGRMLRIALRVQASKVAHPPDEVTSIAFGNDLAHLLPSELALLGDPDLEDLFLYRFAEAQLLQYELIGNEKQGQGPIILAIDSSGSMGTEMQGVSREAWSKAVMLALLAIARKQKRDMVVIYFSGAEDALITFHFPKGQSTYLNVLHCTETFIGGLTAFEPWMQTALILVDESAFNRADVICISDGLASIHPSVQAEWQRRRQRRDMRAYGVLIGTSEGAGVLASVTDAMMTLNNLTDDTGILETIFAV